MSAIVKLSSLALRKKSTKVEPKADTTKMLPQSKVVKKKPSAIVKTDRGALTTTTKPKPANLRTNILSSSKDNILYSIRDKVIKIDELLKDNLKERQKQSEKSRIKKEQKEFKEREEKLELPKGIKMPGLPRIGGGYIESFIEKVKRWVFFTALGWVFDKFFKHLPKLIGIVKVIGKIYLFTETIFKKLLEGLVTFTSKGIELYDATTKWIKDIGGQKFVENFDKFEKALSTFVDLSIVASLLGADIGLSAIDEFKKQKAKQKPHRGEKPRVDKPKGKTPKGKPSKGKVPKRKPSGKPGKVPSWWNKIFKGPFAKLKGPLSKFAGAVVPGLGAVVGAADAAARFKSGDTLGGTLASVSATLDAWTAASAVLAFTGIGAVAPASLATVSMGIDVVLLIRDILKSFGLPAFAEGGQVTRGGQKVGGPVTRGKSLGRVTRRSKKEQKTITKPGKDVGGDANIKALFPDTRPSELKKSAKNKSVFSWGQFFSLRFGGNSNDADAKRKSDDKLSKVKAPNAFKALSDITGIYKGISGFVGSIAGIITDSLLGQKPDRTVYDSIASGILGFIGKIIKNQIGKGASGLLKTISGFAKGGVVQDTNQQVDLLTDKLEGDLSRALEGMIGSAVDKSLIVIRRESRVKPPIAGRDEMLERNLERAREGQGVEDAGGYSQGGIATGLGVPKAVSVAKKLIADLGITPAQAAGIVGNFLYESAGMNPAEVQGAPFGVPEKPPALGTTRVGYGWAQWTNSRPGDRLDKFLKSYGGDKGKIATDDDNYRYLMQELKGAESLRGMPTNDPQAASDWFRVNWERAGIPADQKRRKETLAVYEKIKGLTREKAKADVIAAGAKYIEGSTKADTSAGDGKFIQGNSGASKGIHFHIGPGSYQTGDLKSPKHNDSAREVAFKVVKHFLGKKSIYHGRSGVFYSGKESDTEIKKMVKTEQTEHTAEGSQGGIDIQVGGGYWPGAKVAFPFKVEGMKYRPGGFGVSAKVSGANAFVAHGAYDENGKLAPQELVKYYEKGGETPEKPTQAIVGEKGKEYIINANSYNAIEKVAPGLLDILNYQVRDVPSLKRYMPYILSSLSKGLDLDNFEKNYDKFNNIGSIIKPRKYEINKPEQSFDGIVKKTTGTTVKGAGQDTQLLPVKQGGAAVLKGGETVLQVGARERMIREQGIDPLKYNIGSNANKPREIASNVMGNSYGGIVGLSNGGKVPSATTKNKNPQSNLIKPVVKIILQRLISGGLTQNAAAGIVANMGVETGYTYDPNTYQDGGGPGRGLVQWESGGRFDTDNINLVDFARKRKKQWNDLNTQIDFILYELNNHPEYKIVKAKLNRATAQDAVKIFLTEYEKAGEPHYERRMEVLSQISDSGYLKPKEDKTGTAKTKVKTKGSNPFIDFLRNLTGNVFGKPKNIDKRKGGGYIGEGNNKPQIQNLQSFAPYETPNPAGTTYIQKVYVHVPVNQPSSSNSSGMTVIGNVNNKGYSVLSRV